MAKNLKKLLALILALSMVMSMMCVTAFADENQGYDIKATIAQKLDTGAKFVGIIASVTKDGPTEVVGTVGADYKAELVIPNAYVNPNVLMLGIGMNDVASLGGGNHIHALGADGLAGGAGSHEGTGINIFSTLGAFGLDALEKFSTATIKATIVPVTGIKDKAEVTYTLTGDTFSEQTGKTITGTPNNVNSARDAWQLMTSYVTPSSQPADDSFIVIASGSWLQIGNQVLKFVEGADGITLFTTESDDVEDILEKVKLEDDQTPAMSFGLTKGTTLAVGESVAKLAEDVTVTVKDFDSTALDIALGENEAPVNILEVLQAAVKAVKEAAEYEYTSEEAKAEAEKEIKVGLIVMMAKLMNQAVGAVEGKTINVEIKFGAETEPDEPDEPDPVPADYDIEASIREKLANAKFVGIIASQVAGEKATEVIGTVDADYVAKLVIPNADVNANSLWLGVGMNNVASLGINEPRVHALDEFRIMGTASNGAKLNIFNTLSGASCTALKGFASTTINAKIVAANGTEYPVIYTLKGEKFDEDTGKTITGTPVESDESNVSAAWAAMVNDTNFDITTGAEDSKIVIGNGSWLQIGEKKLQFEADAEGNIVLFANEGSTSVEDILDMVKLVDVEDGLAFSLTKGTTLAVGSSAATLKNDVQVTVEGISADALKVVISNEEDAEPVNILEAVQTIVNTVKSGAITDEQMPMFKVFAMTVLAKLLDNVVGAVEEETINVEIKFTCAEHEYEAAVTALTCTEGGYTTYTCKFCEDSYTDDKTEATGHNWGEWTESKPAAVNEAGEETRTCSVCDATETRETDALPAPAPVVIIPRPTTPVEDEIEDEDPPLSELPISVIFADVADDVWYASAVRFAYDNELMLGVGDGSEFAPTTESTRGMIATILYRVEGKPSVADLEVSFPDVAEDCYYHDAAAWALSAGVFAGYDDGGFHGEDKITREQLATVLYRYAGIKGWNLTGDEAVNDLASFIDNGDIAGWAEAAMNWAASTGLMNGRAADMMAPQGETQRCELATVLMRLDARYNMLNNETIV